MRMILGLDHTGLAVHDLEAARERFTELGFRLTPREALTRPGPDGSTISTGAENHVFMLERGYQEIITITDPAAGHPLVKRLHRYWGLHNVLMATDDADADRQALADRGVDVTPCATWGRVVPGRGEARFRFFAVSEREAPECSLGVVQHLTPELIRSPELLSHPNGARAILGCTLNVLDPAEAAARYGRIFGKPFVNMGQQRELSFGNGTYFRVADGAALKLQYPGSSIPDAPSVAAIELEVPGVDVMAASGIRIHEQGGRRWLDPADVFGAVISLRTG
jgi:catechol 2,3-dioxygenase-like lactoylglutathione lyase family enzyme